MGAYEVGLSGGLYAHATAVTNEVGNQVAEFRGGWDVAIDKVIATWRGQSRVLKDATLVQVDLRFIIPEVAFRPKLLETVHGFTENAADNLKSAGAEAAASYTMDEDTVPPEMQWLVDVMMGGKHMQAFAGDGIATSTTIPFTNLDYVPMPLELLLYSATGSLCEFLLED
jgi:hypothetical protein